MRTDIKFRLEIKTP